MSKFPDFSPQGYQIVREIGQNRTSGRVTYLATKIKNQLPVVIKQFQFAQSGLSWSDYDTYEQEIQLLRRLNHPSIPWYLDSLETPSGFCLVQEYIPAPSLAEPRNFSREEIQQIAIAVLEVLVYLQQQNPPIIHRDLKPENILVNSHLLPDNSPEIKVYLVDFGFARIGGGEVAVSSVVKGTLGFMPPEQLFNRQLTEASDLYGLGVTLICLLTQTKSTQIGNLVDDAYRIKFKHLAPKLNPKFASWLEKMVAPNIKNRYPNALTALKALQSISIAQKPTPFATLINSEQIKRNSLVLGLGSLGLLSVLGAKFAIWKQGEMPNYGNVETNIQVLSETHQCPACDLRDADLRGIDLMGANLNDADLRGANLGTANLASSYLIGANLEGADLTEANLRNANLTNANLTDTNLVGADLSLSNLENANLRGANLEGAELTDSNLTSAELSGANFSRTRMPDGLVHY